MVGRRKLSSLHLVLCFTYAHSCFADRLWPGFASVPGRWDRLVHLPALLPGELAKDCVCGGVCAPCRNGCVICSVAERTVLPAGRPFAIAPVGIVWEVYRIIFMLLLLLLLLFVCAFFSLFSSGLNSLR